MAGLQDIGLSGAEANVYTTLLERGVSTAKILSREADVPLGRIYQVIDGLEEKRLVRVQHDTHPKKVTAVEPGVAIDRLVEQKQQQLTAERERVEQTAESLREQFERKGVVTGEEFVTTAIGTEAALELLLERYAAASKELLLAFREPPAALETGDVEAQPAEMIRRSVDRGVSVHIMLAEPAVPTLPEEQRAALTALADESGVEVRVSDSLSRTVAIIDGVEICLEEHMPASRELFALVNLRDARFTREYRDEMVKLWEEARLLRGPG